jgi:hypothetical protein
MYAKIYRQDESTTGMDLIDVIADVQDELAIVDAVCNAASDASDETREAALQWLLTQHHDEVLMLVCDLRVTKLKVKFTKSRFRSSREKQCLLGSM